MCKLFLLNRTYNTFIKNNKYPNPSHVKYALDQDTRPLQVHAMSYVSSRVYTRMRAYVRACAQSLFYDLIYGTLSPTSTF